MDTHSFFFVQDKYIIATKLLCNLPQKERQIQATRNNTIHAASSQSNQGHLEKFL